jgi:hypothetical protein
MTQLNKTTAKQLATKLEAYDATLDTQEHQLADLLHFTKQHKIDREHVAYAITQYVAHKYSVPLNDKAQFVKAESGKAKEAWNAARKRKQRLMQSIYGEAKPAVKRNKVDPLESEAKRLRSKYTAKQLKALFASLGV